MFAAMIAKAWFFAKVVEHAHIFDVWRLQKR